MERRRDFDNKISWMQVLEEKDRSRLLGPHKKVQQWIENTRNATRPHFDEVHKVIFKVKEKLQNQRLKGASNDGTESSMKKPLLSKM